MAKIELSREMIQQGRSSKGGYSKAQLELLGVKWPPKKGWIDKKIAKKFDEEKIKQFIELRDAHLKEV